MPGQNANINSLIEEGLRHKREGNIEEAEKCYRQVLSIDPNNAEVYQLLGHLAHATKNFTAGAQLMRKSLSIDPRHPQVWLAYALLMRETRQDEETIRALEKALKIKPDYPEVHFNLGLAKVSSGRAEEAPAHLREAINYRPDYADAYRVLALLDCIEQKSPEFTKIESLLTKPDLSKEDHFVLHYALANIYKKSGNKKAFAKHLFEANRLQTECSPKNPEAASLHQRIKAAFTKEKMEKANQANPAGFTPIFIVGMPRSGTTLIERILSSHPQVEAGEELQFLRTHTAERLTQETQKHYPEGFEDLSVEQLNTIALEYTDRIQRLFPEAKFVTDKNLANFFTIGMIKLVLPNAKVIALHRDPMDTCFSILQHFFNNQMRYCCDIELLATFYREYLDQVEHWHRVTPGFVMDVRYEDIIEDQEGQTRRLLEFCGLKWDDACLDFHQNDNAVRTISANQVRQPIYASSIGNWKKYHNELAPLVNALGDLVVD